jgi:hypothetical protein
MRVWLLAWLSGLACSNGARESAARPLSSGSSPARAEYPDAPGKELIPAEWTVSEDTSETGEVTTASVQLPAAKDIGGLLEEEAPRLVLRCVDGKVEAAIAMEPDAGVSGQDSSQGGGQRVPIRLDSAPPCE